MNTYCKNECPDWGTDVCVLPSVKELAAAHCRIAVRSVMEATSRIGRGIGEERFEPDWQLGAAKVALDGIKRRVTECVEEHLYSNVIQLDSRTEL